MKWRSVPIDVVRERVTAYVKWETDMVNVTGIMHVQNNMITQVILSILTMIRRFIL